MAAVRQQKRTMSLGNLATFVVLPPVNLIGVALVGAVLAFRTRRVGQAIATAGLLAMAVLAMPATAGWLLQSLETGLVTEPDPAHPPGAIVVLGGDVQRRPDGGSDIGGLSLERVRAGAALARRTGLPLLVSGGLTGDDLAPVCQVMAESLQDDFARPARWLECRSIDTWENAEMSAAVLRPAGIGSVYVVTHGWHMRRSLMAFQPTGLVATAAPTGLDALPTTAQGGLVPTVSGLARSYFAIHEWVGIVAYRLRLMAT